MRRDGLDAAPAPKATSVRTAAPIATAPVPTASLRIGPQYAIPLAKLPPREEDRLSEPGRGLSRPQSVSRGEERPIADRAVTLGLSCGVGLPGEREVIPRRPLRCAN